MVVSATFHPPCTPRRRTRDRAQGVALSRACRDQWIQRAPTHSAPSMTYRAAGVDIEAGDALVEAIKPLARATARPGVIGGMGGFGALFDLKAAGFADPVWSPPPTASAPS